MASYTWPYQLGFQVNGDEVPVPRQKNMVAGS